LLIFDFVGRGQGPRNHPGNRYLREKATEYAPMYNATSKRSEKNDIASLVVDLVENRVPPGRFLMRVEKGSNSLQAQTDKKENLERVKQMIRDIISKGTRPIKPEPIKGWPLEKDRKLLKTNIIEKAPYNEAPTSSTSNGNTSACSSDKDALSHEVCQGHANMLGHVSNNHHTSHTNVANSSISDRGHLVSTSQYVAPSIMIASSNIPMLGVQDIRINTLSNRYTPPNQNHPPHANFINYSNSDHGHLSTDQYATPPLLTSKGTSTMAENTNTLSPEDYRGNTNVRTNISNGYYTSLDTGIAYVSTSTHDHLLSCNLINQHVAPALTSTNSPIAGVIRRAATAAPAGFGSRLEHNSRQPLAENHHETTDHPGLSSSIGSFSMTSTSFTTNSTSDPGSNKSEQTLQKLSDISSEKLSDISSDKSPDNVSDKSSDNLSDKSSVKSSESDTKLILD